jgi:hypothetical protein
MASMLLQQYWEGRVLDDKLESLMAELRAIELWDQLPEGAALMNEIDRAGALEARRRRRHEIINEIDVRCKEHNSDPTLNL